MMKSTNQCASKNKKGFTLVEIMIVVVIIGLLASMAVPAFKRARTQAQETAIRNNMRQIWGAAQQYMMENGNAKIKIDDIVQYQVGKGTEATTEGAEKSEYTSVIKPVLNENYGLITCQSSGATAYSTTGGEIPDDAVKMRVFYTRTAALPTVSSEIAVELDI